MSERIDGFSRKLASGMSRRKAFWQLFTGAGGLGALALVTTQKASADDASCPTQCFQQAQLAYTDCVEDTLGEPLPSTNNFFICLPVETIAYQQCLGFSAACPSGKCAVIQYTVTPGEIDVTGYTCA
jgi:hypothetical protein